MIWLNKTVEQIFRARLQFFKAEAACFSQRQQSELFDKARYLTQYQQLKQLNLSMEKTTHTSITNQQITDICSRQNLIKSMYEQLTGEPATDEDKFVPMSMSEFIRTQFIKNNLGQTLKAETFVIELRDACCRFGRISAQARLLMLFWTDEVPNYEVYRTLCGLGEVPEEPFCRDSFEQYRKNYNLTEREFESIRR